MSYLGCHTHPFGCPVPAPIVCLLCRRRCYERPCFIAVLRYRVRRFLRNWKGIA